jgi:hypothetical protein
VENKYKFKFLNLSIGYFLKNIIEAGGLADVFSASHAGLDPASSNPRLR